MGLFKRKKKVNEPVTAFKMVNSLLTPLVPFGDVITNSDVVKMCIDRVASHCAKLKMTYIKTNEKGEEIEKNGDISYALKFRPNEYMTPFQFLYKVVTLLLINDNAFIYPLYDKNEGTLKGIYPLRPQIVEPIMDSSNGLFLRFYFEDGSIYLLPYENVIHVKRFYGQNDIFGGSGSKGDHEALLKTLKINDALLQGVEGAVYSSFQIRGIVKINGILKEADKQKQIDEFNRAVKKSSSDGSAVIPIDSKSEYIPLNNDPKLVDSTTLDFIQSKILDYFGVSKPILDNNYNEDEFNAFYESTIEPIAIQISEAFSLGLLTDNQLTRGEKIILFSERLQYASWQTKVNAIEKLMGLGVMSLNESRALLGLEPIEGGDKRLQSLNYVDADKANQYQVGNNKEDNNDEW